MRTTSRAPNHAFIWNCVDQKCEIIDTLSGLTSSRMLIEFFINKIYRKKN